MKARRAPVVRKSRPQPRGERDFAFQCKIYQLPPPIEQFPFALPLQRKFTADFAFPSQRLLIEINGGVFMRGRSGHSSGVGIARDMEKAQYAALLGYITVPFTPEEVHSGHAIEWTTRILHKLGWRDDPAPLPDKPF